MFVAENHNSLVIVHYRRTGEEGDRRIWSHSVANLHCVERENTRKDTHIITSMNLSMIKGVWLGILMEASPLFMSCIWMAVISI